MLIIGICGASGSGKTTLANNLEKSIKGKTVLINQDTYYYDHPELTEAERAALNFDRPEAFEHDLLLKDVQTLCKGQSVRKHTYDFTIHRRTDGGEIIEPGDVLIIEGIHTFYDASLREMMDIKLYMRVDPDVCLLRRAVRDIKERGRTIEGVARQYSETVKPMYERWIRNYIQYADLIAADGSENSMTVELLSTYINQKLLEKAKNR